MVAQVGIFAGTCCCGGFTGLLDCRGTGDVCPSFFDRGPGICINPCIPQVFFITVADVKPGVEGNCCTGLDGGWPSGSHFVTTSAPTITCSWNDRSCDQEYFNHCDTIGNCFELNINFDWEPQTGGGVIFTISTDADGILESIFEKFAPGDENGQIDCQDDPLGGGYIYTTSEEAIERASPGVGTGGAEFDFPCIFSDGATMTVSDPSGFDPPCLYCV